MNLVNYDVVSATAIRRALVRPNDLREDVAFQNDVNRLMATLQERLTPMRALGWFGDPSRPGIAHVGDLAPPDTTPPRILRVAPARAADTLGESAPDAPPAIAPVAIAPAAIARPAVDRQGATHEFSAEIEWAPTVRRPAG